MSKPIIIQHGKGYRAYLSDEAMTNLPDSKLHSLSMANSSDYIQIGQLVRVNNKALSYLLALNVSASGVISATISDTGDKPYQYISADCLKPTDFTTIEYMRYKHDV